MTTQSNDSDPGVAESGLGVGEPVRTELFDAGEKLCRVSGAAHFWSHPRRDGPRECLWCYAQSDPPKPMPATEPASAPPNPIPDQVLTPLSAEDEEWMNAPLGPPRPTWASQLGALYDDAFVYIRATAREHGYAVARHGSEVRDFDLIAVPWTETASTPATLAEAVRDAVHGAFTQSTADATTAGCATHRPHGRLTWAINLKHSASMGDALAASSANFHPYIDLSVFPPAAALAGVPKAAPAMPSGLREAAAAYEDLHETTTRDTFTAGAEWVIRKLAGVPKEAE